MDYRAIEKLVRLRDQGALTEDEFTAYRDMIVQRSASRTEFSLRRFLDPQAIKHLSLSALALGGAITSFGTYFYDVYGSPTELPSAYAELNEFSSDEHKYLRFKEIKDRFESSLRGEKVFLYARQETKKKIISWGSFFMAVGLLGLLASIKPWLTGTRS